MFALDLDSLSPERHPGREAFLAGRDLGFRSFALGRARRDLPATDLVPLLRRERLTVCALPAPLWAVPAGEERPLGELLAAADEAVRRAAGDRLRAVVEEARRYGSPTLLLELGSLARAASGSEGGEESDVEVRARRVWTALDRLLPALYDILRATSEVALAVVIPATAEEWPSPDEMEILLSEIGEARLGWWYDAGRAERLGRERASWRYAYLDRFLRRLKGVHLADVGGDEEGVPPGSGEVDFAFLQELLPRGVPEVVRLDPRFPPDAVVAARRFLEEKGFGG